MLVTMRPVRTALVLSLLLSSVVVSSSARGDERVECARAYEQSQRLQQRGENKKALDAAERCAQPTCPPLLAEECKPWVTQIRQQLARLEIHVTGSDACPAHDFVIEIDRVKQPAGSELLVDPGVHEVRVVDAATKHIADQTINAAAGQRHAVELGFAPPGAVCGSADQAAGGPSSHAAIPGAAVGLGIAGGALLLTGIVLGVVGAVKRGDLDACKPNCSTDAIDGARTFFVAGDVVGGVGILALGAAAAVYFLARADVAPRASGTASVFGPKASGGIRPNAHGFEIRF
jgi:hypothetical protein